MGTRDISMNDYQMLAARTINRELSEDETVLHALFGMASEIGEVHSVYQKFFQGHPIKDDELVKEIGDVLWMIAELCTALGLDMGYIARENIEKLKKRYPEGFDPDRSVNRVKYEKPEMIDMPEMKPCKKGM